MRPPVVAASGDVLEPRILGPITQTDVVRFAGAGGDFNPLHHDPAAATAAGFPAPIAMGQFTAGILAAWLTDWSGVEHLRSFEIRFTSPLHLGATVVLSGAVDKVTDGVAVVSARATAAETVVATASATVVVSAG